MCSLHQDVNQSCEKNNRFLSNSIRYNLSPCWNSPLESIATRIKATTAGHLGDAVPSFFSLSMLVERIDDTD